MWMRRETQIDIHRRDRLEEAQERLQEGRHIRSAVGHKLGVARSLFALGELAQAKGSLVEACDCYRQSLGLLEPLRAPSGRDGEAEASGAGRGRRDLSSR
jgi:hypothetical protein